jgi:putative membrane protein
LSARRGVGRGALHYAQGLMMGAADVVPGVSGGTVALIVGIYERLVGSIRACASAAVRLVRGDLAGMRRNADEVHWSLVLPLGLGIVTALLIGARFIPGILEAHPERARGLFFGLIAGSIAIPWKRITAPTRSHVLAAALASAAAFLLVGMPPREIRDPPLVAVFAAASVAICAMILPGVSGSFLLLVMGIYETTLRALSGRDIPYIVVFTAGAAIGLGIFARILEACLRRYHDLTMALLVGLMIGSLRALWPWLDEARQLHPPPGGVETLVVLAMGVLGFALVSTLVAVGRRRVGTARVDGRHPGA